MLASMITSKNYDNIFLNNGILDDLSIIAYNEYTFSQSILLSHINDWRLS